MEMWSTRSFDAIPATLIRGVCNLYLSKLLGKLYCKYPIYLFNYISFFTIFFKWQLFNFLLAYFGKLFKN